MKQNLPLYEFGRFTLDPADGLLMRANNLVRLTPKAIDVLYVLVQSSGRVIEKEELMRLCWPDAIVEEANLPQTICILRKALGKSGRKSQYIHTVSRRGYRFKAAVVVRDRAATDAATNGNGKPRTEESGDASRLLSARGHSDYASDMSAEARHQYLRGRYYCAQYTVAGLKEAIEHFQAATQADSSFALPYSGLADCYYRLANICMRPGLAMPKAKAAVLRALQLDPSLAEAHALFGLIKQVCERNWSSAESEFAKAITLAPDCPLVHKRYGWALGISGDFDEATKELLRALELEPRSAELHVTFGIILHLARKYEQALFEAHVALDLQPDFYPARTLLGMASLQKVRLVEGVAELQKAVAIADVPWNLGYLGYAYAIMGRPKQALKIVTALEQRADCHHVALFSLALIYAGLGWKERALLCLIRMLNNPNEMMGLIRYSPELDCLRQEPEFLKLLERGIP